MTIAVSRTQVAADERSLFSDTLGAVVDAATALGDTVTMPAALPLEGLLPADLDALAGDGATVVVAIGQASMGPAEVAARAHPATRFLVVGAQSNLDRPPPNLTWLTFEFAPVGFIAGYVAAAMTKSGKVGAFGAADVLGAHELLGAFRRGVEHRNAVKGRSVQVLGIGDDSDPPAMTASGYDRAAEALRFLQTLSAQGVDVAFPVLGVASRRLLEASVPVNIVWLHVDDPDRVRSKHAARMLTTIRVDTAGAVRDMVTAIIRNETTPPPRTIDLPSRSIWTSTFLFDGRLPEPALQVEIDELVDGVVDGMVAIA